LQEFAMPELMTPPQTKKGLARSEPWAVFPPPSMPAPAASPEAPVRPAARTCGACGSILRGLALLPVLALGFVLAVSGLLPVLLLAVLLLLPAIAPLLGVSVGAVLAEEVERQEAAPGRDVSFEI
jgi:hypothetical protein